MTKTPAPRCPKCGYDLTALPGNTCPECGSEFTPEEINAGAQRRAARRRFGIALATTFIVMYAPYSWLLWIDYPWNNYHWHWVKMWLGLPVLFPVHSCMDGASYQILVMHLFSAVIFAGAVFLASRRRRMFFLTLVPLALLSILNAFGLYRAFLM